MEYLQNLDEAFNPKSISQGPVWEAIRDSAVVYDLHLAGYKTVAFATGFAWSELDNSDVYISPPYLWSGPNDFEILLLGTTPVRYLDGRQIFDLEQWLSGH